MNDPSEGGYSVDTFMADYKEIESQYGSKYPFLTVLKEQAEQHQKDFQEVCNMPTEPYSTCFSRKRDSLSHWERYSQGMTGICIGFDLDELYGINLQLFEAFSLKEISYDKESRKNRIFEGLKKYYEQIKQNTKEPDDNKICDILKIKGYTHLAATYQSILYFVKDNYWNEEAEIRLLYDDCSWNNKIRLFKQIEETWKIKITDKAEQWHDLSGLANKEFVNFSTIRSCRYLNLEEDWSSKLIPEIIIGPFSRQNSSELNDFIVDSGLKETKVLKSEIKIR